MLVTADTTGRQKHITQNTSNMYAVSATAAVLGVLLIGQCLAENTDNVVHMESEQAAEDMLDFKYLMHILSKPRKVFLGAGFSWKSCGSASDLASVSSITTAPDPLVLPGNITVGFSAALSQTISAPVQLELDVQKKVLFWITVPCVDGVGSCTYPDICGRTKTIQCPAALQKVGLNCKCPVKQGKYVVPPFLQYVDPVGVPSWLTDGSYKVRAKVSTKGKQIACLDITAAITNKK